MTTLAISSSTASSRAISPCSMRLERNARPFGNDVQNIFFIHLHAFFFAAGAPFLQNRFQFFFGVLFLVAHGGGAFEILVLDRAFFLAS